MPRLNSVMREFVFIRGYRDHRLSRPRGQKNNVAEKIWRSNRIIAAGADDPEVLCTPLLAERRLVRAPWLVPFSVQDCETPDMTASAINKVFY